MVSASDCTRQHVVLIVGTTKLQQPYITHPNVSLTVFNLCCGTHKQKIRMRTYVRQSCKYAAIFIMRQQMLDLTSVTCYHCLISACCSILIVCCHMVSPPKDTDPRIRRCTACPFISTCPTCSCTTRSCKHMILDVENTSTVSQGQLVQAATKPI